jgi:hypothetical protein
MCLFEAEKPGLVKRVGGESLFPTHSSGVVNIDRFTESEEEPYSSSSNLSRNP